MTDHAATLVGTADETSGLRIQHSALLGNPVKVGMLAFLLSEVAFFSTLITTYVVFLRESKENSPNPAEVFKNDWPLVLTATACLLSSSVAIHFAERAFGEGNRSRFLGLWSFTIALGAAFLVCTAKEWYELITHYGLTIARNMFGSSYFTLVGFHAVHVTVGLILLSIMLVLGWRRKISPEHKTGVEVVSWYWHFVDGVWIFVFSLVYIIGR